MMSDGEPAGDVNLAPVNLGGSSNEGVGSIDLTSKPTRKRAREAPAAMERFQLPFNLKCDGCGSIIAKGVKVNIAKKAVGSYYKSKIWRFTTKCGYCQCKIILENIPQQSKYKVIRGSIDDVVCGYFNMDGCEGVYTAEAGFVVMGGRSGWL